jgi:hypothetical protein
VVAALGPVWNGHILDTVHLMYEPCPHCGSDREALPVGHGRMQALYCPTCDYTEISLVRPVRVAG